MSNQDQNQQLDQWELALEEYLVVLKKCQQDMQLDSCTNCEKFFDCTTRKEYVIKVYESMNKGSGGGFEF
jgi:hypothetical protein